MWDCSGFLQIRSHITQGKISCKILDTLQEKGHFTCKFLTRFLLLAKNCARNVKFLAQFLQVLQVSCKKGDIFSARSVHRTCKYLQDIFPWVYVTYTEFTWYSTRVHTVYCRIHFYLFRIIMVATVCTLIHHQPRKHSKQFPVKTILPPICKSCKYFSCKTCKILHYKSSFSC